MFWFRLSAAIFNSCFVAVKVLAKCEVFLGAHLATMFRGSLEGCRFGNCRGVDADLGARPISPDHAIALPRSKATQATPLEARLIPRLARALFVSVLMHIGSAGRMAGFLGRVEMKTGRALMQFDAAGRPIQRRSRIEKMLAGRVGYGGRGRESVTFVTTHYFTA